MTRQTLQLLRLEARRHRALAALMEEPALIRDHQAVARALDRAARICRKSKSENPSPGDRQGSWGRIPPTGRCR